MIAIAPPRADRADARAPRVRVGVGYGTNLRSRTGFVGAGRRCFVVIASLVLAACGHTNSRIGPYLVNIERRGDELALVLCDILLESGQLRQGQCSEQRVPLSAVAPPSETPPAPPRH